MGRQIRYSRPKIAAPETLLDFLCTRFSYLSRDAWMEHLAAGHLSVFSRSDNDTVSTSADYVLRQNDEIRFDPPRELEPEIDEHIQILHDDDAILVCVKNGNLPVAEGGRYCSNTLVGLLQRRSAASVDIDKDATVRKKRDREEEGKDKDVGIETNKTPATYFPVHRLDKETSGLVVLAKQAASARSLSTQFEQQSERLAAEISKQTDSSPSTLTAEEFEQFVKKEKSVNKSYIAVLAGAAPEGAVFVVCDRIGLLFDGLSNGNSTEVMKQHMKLKKLKMTCFSADIKENPQQRGRPAVSRVRILASDAALGVSVASVDILTGRTHQIRLHCAQLGYPVLGDKLYETSTPGVLGGCGAVADDIYLARARGSESLVSPAAPHFRVKRHLLHAAVLSFLHPISGERMLFFADPREWFLRDIEEEKEGMTVNPTADNGSSALKALQQLLERAVGVLNL